MNEGLIIVKQLPIIEEKLKKVSEEIYKKVEYIDTLVCSEENVKVIKEVRAGLNKEAKEFEDKRKQVKSEIMKPYEEFENSYKKYIAEPYKIADNKLKNKIDNVENELKANKKAEVENYFDEYLKSKSIDFVTFENANINVTLSASMKSLKEQAKNFIDKIASDLKLIELQEHKVDILVEYKKTLDVTLSAEIVNDRLKAIEEEKAKQEREKELQEYILETARESDHVPTIEEVPQMALEAPAIVETEEILTLKFTVRGTRTQLKALKEFLEREGYDYE